MPCGANLVNKPIKSKWKSCETPDVWRFLDSAKNYIRWVSLLDEERVEVHFKMTSFCAADFPHLNIFIACFTTCHVRLLLYRALDNLKEHCLYSGTDSVIFVRRDKDPPLNPPSSEFLGDFTYQLDSCDYIVEFCSGGPKNYGYKTAHGKVECKVRGFSLNFEGKVN